MLPFGAVLPRQYGRNAFYMEIAPDCIAYINIYSLVRQKRMEKIYAAEKRD